MLTLYRRHSHSKKDPCKYTSSSEKRCSCPIWVTGWMDGEKVPRQAVHSRTWAEAEREIDSWQRKADPAAASAVPASKSPLAVDAAEKYLQHCQVEANAAASTLTSYRGTLKHFLAFLKSQRLECVGDITVQMVRDYLATRAKYTPRTRRKELEHLRFFLWFCVDNEWITRNPAAAKGSRGVRVKVPRGGSTLPLSDHEIDLLLRAADVITNNNPKWIVRARLRARALILVLAYTGLRISDTMALKRSDVKPDGSIELEIIKTRQPLSIVLNQQVLDALRALPKDSFYFFWSGPSESKLTTAAGSARRTLASLGAKTGINVHPHRFRDTFALKVLESTGDIRALQIALGHTSVRTTENAYVHLGEQHKQRIRDTFAKVQYIRPA